MKAFLALGFRARSIARLVDTVCRGLSGFNGVAVG